VGYIIPSAQGYIEEEAPRMVMTPWFDTEIPFNMAAEVGTRKVITEHSTIGLVITTDGSFTELPRDEYEEAEERVISELKAAGKPFAVLLNTSDPDSAEARRLCEELSRKYETDVMPVNCTELEEEDIRGIMANVLYSFPVREIGIAMPEWINTLGKGHWLKEAVFAHIREAAEGVETLRQISACADTMGECEHIEKCEVKTIDAGSGSAVISAQLFSDLFYRVIGEATGLEINGENELLPRILELVEIRKRFAKYKDAIAQMERTGYGIVMPEPDELTMEEPEIIRQGGKYGIRLKAQAPAIHLIRTEINTEVAPIVGSEKQSEELVMYMMSDFEKDPDKIWSSNIFGKSLHELVSDGLHTKLSKLPDDARMRLKETVERMINEGCSGLICLIL
jgi:stage IV sporulation protein A